MKKVLLTVTLFALVNLAFSQTPAPPSQATASDVGNDAGGSVLIEWQISPDDKAGGSVLSYEIYRSESSEGAYVKVGEAPGGTTSNIDASAKNNKDYFYKARAIALTGFADSPASSAVQAKSQWFRTDRVNALIAVLILSGAILYFIWQASRGKELYVRKIAGIEAVDEAVGRATEMGKKIVFVPGIQDMSSMQTIAAVTILGHIAKKAAEHNTILDIPNNMSMVMVACREVVKQAYTAAGRPDAYREDLIYYLTQDQFGYTAAVDGLFVREKPAAIFLLGHFYAESLVLAETGNYIGAIQIAGTAQPSQLPFFVAACDYTLIGEELFAASAYLSKDTKLLGSLKGQDVGKFLIMAAILVGVILKTLGIYDLSRIFIVQ